MKTLMIMLSVALATSACATHTIRYKNPTVAATGETKNAKQSFFLWGLVGGSEVDLQQMCPSGVAAIEDKASVVDGILTAVTGGLYSPRSVEVRCAGGTTGAMR